MGDVKDLLYGFVRKQVVVALYALEMESDVVPGVFQTEGPEAVTEGESGA